MKRQLSAVAAIAATSTLCLSAVAAATVVEAAADQPRADVRDFVCRHALDPPNRMISLQAVMRPLAATRKLELKFDLLVNRGSSSGSQSELRAGDLGGWISPSNSTLGQLPGDVWKFDKSVVALAAPASYRFRVTFRWIGSQNRVIGSAVRYSSRCRERELRPDLLVQAPIGVTPIAGAPNQDLYTAVIENAGASAAGPFDVLFAPGDNSPPQTDRVKLLDSNQSVTETFVGPLCITASAPTITADSAAQVDDLSRANNALTAICPAPGSG